MFLSAPSHSIHERSAREKISSDQVAHVLNDEVSRKYIQSLKRWVCCLQLDDHREQPADCRLSGS